MAGKHEFRVYKGDTWVNTLTWTDANDAAVNLTGYTASLVITSNCTGSVIDTLTSGDGLTLGGSAGTIAISRATSTYTVGSHRYTLTLTSGASVVTTLLAGPFVVEQYDG